jgi:hypothetical protein
MHPAGLVEPGLPGRADVLAGELLLEWCDDVAEEAAEPCGVIRNPVARGDDGVATPRHRNDLLYRVIRTLASPQPIRKGSHGEVRTRAIILEAPLRVFTTDGLRGAGMRATADVFAHASGLLLLARTRRRLDLFRLDGRELMRRHLVQPRREPHLLSLPGSVAARL